MKDFSYPARVRRTRQGVFEVQFLDIDEAFTEGESLDEALKNASEVLSGVILARISRGVGVPEPKKAAKGAAIRYVLPDGKTQSALVVRDAFQDRNMAEIARAMKTSWPALNRLRNPQHWPTLRLLDRALRAAGKELVLGVRNRDSAPPAKIRSHVRSSRVGRQSK